MSEVRKPGESERVANKEEVGSVPASEKKPRSGNRVEGKTKVFVGESIVPSAELLERVREILEFAETKLAPEVVENIRNQFERSVVRGLRTIAEKKVEDPLYETSDAKGSLYSAKMEMLKNLIENAIQNSNSADKEDRLIPELRTRRAITQEFGMTMQTLTEEEKLVLVALDLDGFKKINDTLGHVTGDKVLRSFGVSLFGAPRPDDVVAHYSGDEFGLLLKVKKEDNVQSILERILKKAQDDKNRPVEGIQEVSSGFVEVGFDDKDRIDFDTARDMSDRAANVSKTLDILLEIRGTKAGSAERIIPHSEIENVKSEYPEEEWKIADMVRGLKREMGHLLSVNQMAEIAKMTLSGEIQEILEKRGVK